MKEDDNRERHSAKSKRDRERESKLNVIRTLASEPERAGYGQDGSAVESKRTSERTGERIKRTLQT